MVLDRYVEIIVNDKPVKLCYPLRVLFRAERELSTKNVLKALSSPPLTMEDTYVLFKYAVIGGGYEGETEELFLAALGELSYIGLFDKLVEALGKSGALGNGNAKNR